MATTLLESLQELRRGLGERDVSALRRLSHNTAKKMAIDDGDDMLQVALIGYIFSKLLTKIHYWGERNRGEFISFALKRIDKCIRALSKNEMPVFHRNLSRILTDIRGLESSDSRFISDIETSARTKMASTFYAEGFSLSSAAAMAGVEKQTLQRYVGRTLIADRSGKTRTMDERLENVRALFT